MSQKADIGVVGLAVMGQNLILNMESKGYVVCAFNRTVEKVYEFTKKEAKGKKIIGAVSLEDMVMKLKVPRIVMLMVKGCSEEMHKRDAGDAVDEFMENLLLLLNDGDVIIDGGNSNYVDTQRRVDRCLQRKHVLYVGCGVSGGEEGARYGPSLMPGGRWEAWDIIKKILQDISAKVGDTPCCQWVGEGGSGHFVKMVHNGIEYGDMQLICEAYHVMRELGMSNPDMAEVFNEWNKGELDSYLIEITRNILVYKDDVSGGDGYLVDRIADMAGQKGTGKWTAIAALDNAAPLTLIAEAVFARYLSCRKYERIRASKEFKGPREKPKVEDLKGFLKDLSKAVYCSKIISYTQGYMLLREAASNYKWNMNYGDIALMWRGGCIIRSVFLQNIKEAYDRNYNLSNLALDPFFQKALNNGQAAWRRVVSSAILWGIPVPTLSSALAYYDGYRCENSPANLLQAQRDYFGAHTYAFLGEEGVFRHTNWTGTGGNTSSSSYQA